MKFCRTLLSAALVVVSYLPVFADQAAPRTLTVLMPPSSGFSVKDAAKRSHTRLRVLVVPNAASSTTSAFNTPSTIRSVYNLPSIGGADAIAIVDAYDYPTSLNDFNYFANYFGLPTETSTSATATSNKTFQVVYAPGYAPQSGGSYIASWNLEAALDIEWAHAMAPKAKIYLVEAASDSTNDLDYAVRVAAAQAGVKEVSMSWGGSEESYEASMYDSVFSTAGVVYFASGGDQASTMEYPAASPNVVSVGGTSINRSSTGAFVSETGWSDTGCGPSAYEPRPSFQNKVASVVGNMRGVSDISFVADPNTGVYVYDTTPEWGDSGWWILGGTSVACPCMAGVANLSSAASGTFAANTLAEENIIYNNLGNSKVLRDITSGTDGSFSCAVGYDYITGCGVPNGLLPSGISFLSHPTPVVSSGATSRVILE